MPDAIPWTWSAGGAFSERLDWLTNVLPAATGPEQHRRLRLAPRIVWSFDALESADSRRQMEAALIGNGADGWLAPLWPDASLLLAPWTLGDLTNELEVDTTFRRFVVGRSVLLIAPDHATFEVGVVAAMSDSMIELEGAPAASWPAGTLVCPLVAARFEAMPNLSRFTGNDAPVKINLHSDEAVDWEEDAGEAVYRSVPVLEYRPSGSGDPTFAPERQIERVDAASGVVTVYDAVGIALSAWAAPYVLIGREEIASFRSLLYALAGRWGVVWVPTWADDLRVIAGLSSASVNLDVAWTGFSVWDLRPNRRDVRIELRDGTVLYRRVTSASALGSGERLVLDAAFGVDAAVDDVAQVSFLMLARQDTDVNLLRYWRDDVVETDLQFKGVLDDDV